MGFTWLMSYFHWVCLCSTPVLVPRVQARLWPLPVPAWRNSAVLHSLSVTAGVPATTTPTPTVFGLLPLKTARCLRKTEILSFLDCLFFPIKEECNTILFLLTSTGLTIRRAAVMYSCTPGYCEVWLQVQQSTL